ncbi:hypothetical protein FA95DRAFT_1600078 [Auriscalpium vulgare]|uniref:Uncharacterized protein n=1 Tax=Auriscalpium vulgare TaxID=40419 RepID=A0ACB8R3N0_9AGAM|nr:hypothetical protein FA95DRAFT_1600078 [Auriscalpium vulgare]
MCSDTMPSFPAHVSRPRFLATYFASSHPSTHSRETTTKTTTKRTKRTTKKRTKGTTKKFPRNSVGSQSLTFVNAGGTSLFATGPFGPTSPSRSHSASTGQPLFLPAHRTDVAGNLSDMIKPSDEFASLSPDLSHALILRIFVGTSMHPALCTPMPLLRTLDLSSILQFPANLLGGASTPCLRHLGLACPGKLPWPSLPFAAAHLVSLEIGRFSADSMCSATFEDVFSPLERMPALERLVLRVNIDGTDGAHRVVALEQLRHIEVGNRMRVAGVRRFLEHLALPAVVTLGCSVYGAGRNRDEVRALFQLVTAYIPVKSRIGPLSSIQCKPIKTDYLPSVKVIAWRDVDAQDQPALALTFKLNKYGGRLTQMQTHIVQFALDALVSEDLRELGVWIGGDDPAWMDVLERVPKLQHLSVKGTAAAIALCDVLFHGKCAEDFLPALGTLTLADLNFWHLSMDSGRADPLRWWLVKRARAGRALRKLDLTECDADEEFKRKMKMAVPRLTVLYAEEMIW